MINGFVTFFTETDVLCFIALAVSLACLIAEIFIPSFGLVGIGGICIGLAGIGLNVSKPWYSATEIVWLIIDTFIIFIVVLLPIKLIVSLRQKKKKNRKVNYLIIDGNKVPADENGNPDFSFLKGKAGTCVTDLKPSGKVEIEGIVYNVLADKGYLYNGNMVRVIKSNGASIYVEKIQS